MNRPEEFAIISDTRDKAEQIKKFFQKYFPDSNIEEWLWNGNGNSTCYWWGKENPDDEECRINCNSTSLPKRLTKYTVEEITGIFEKSEEPNYQVY